MQTIDLIIIFGYLIGITAFGILYAGKQETTEDYFVGNRQFGERRGRASGAKHEYYVRHR